MGITQKAIEAYKLPLKLVDGSGATMTAALKSAIDNHQWRQFLLRFDSDSGGALRFDDVCPTTNPSDFAMLASEWGGPVAQPPPGGSVRAR